LIYSDLTSIIPNGYVDNKEIPQSLLALGSYFLSDVFPQLLSATSMHLSYFSLVEIQIGMDATILTSIYPKPVLPGSSQLV
jgi:hypothetical protein